MADSHFASFDLSFTRSNRISTWRNNAISSSFFRVLSVLPRNVRLAHAVVDVGSSTNLLTSSPVLVRWDSFQDILDLETKASRKHSLGTLQVGKYVKELPCPSCRGRGYIPCDKCDICGPNATCLCCLGKGITTCLGCSGRRVTWGGPVSVSLWEKTHLYTTIKVFDDEVIEEMNIPVKAQWKRTYGPLSTETRQKISQSLKDLERRTGSISSRMKELHKNPALRAQRVAAIKKAKSTEEARKHISAKQKAFFMNPENRLKRSIRMKGVKYFCKFCGLEGHRKNYCPTRKEMKPPADGPRPYRCSQCGKLGHSTISCPSNMTPRQQCERGAYRCSCCNQSNHNRRTCPHLISSSKPNIIRRDIVLDM